MPKLNQDQIKAAKFYQTSNRSIVVQAFAGTGKTSFVLSLSDLPKSRNAVYVVFSNAAKDELVKRKPTLDGRVKTLYSIGNQATRRLLEHDTEVQGGKYNRILSDIIYGKTFISKCDAKSKSAKVYQGKESKTELSGLINLCLVNLLFDKLDIYNFVGRHCNLDSELESWVVYTAIQNGLKEAEKKGIISFSDMVALPFSPLSNALEPSSLFDKHDVVFLDEAQDSSPAQIAIVQSIVGRQLVAIGDRFQNLYGFNGSSDDSLKWITESFNAETFTFPLCYRCGDEILDHVKGLVPEIQGTGKPSSVIYANSPTEAYRYLDSLSIFGDWLIVSRVNSVLIEPALFFLDRKIPFSFNRSNVENQIKGKIKEYKEDCTNFADLPKKMAIDYEFAINTRNNKLVDILDCISAILKQRPNIDGYAELINTVRALFYSQDARIKLGSVHSFKGSEADNVLVWGNNLFPHPRSSDEQGEKNCYYVACTRAKKNLVLLELE